MAKGMNYSTDAFVTMLLTMSLSPNREEYARPYATQELRRLETRMHAAGLFHLSQLMNVDIGGLMLKLDISEEEAYRLYTLLNRSVQLSYSLEGHLKQNIEVVTCCDPDYPDKLTQRIGDNAPAMFYRCGSDALLLRPMLGIVGISGIKTSPEARAGIEALVRNGIRLGYTILTGGEMGVGRIACKLVRECGGTLVEVLGGGLSEHIHEENIAPMLDDGSATVISLEHPEALYTVSHAIARNKLLFSLAEAAFIFNTDGKRGEGDAIRNRYCEWIYAWQGWPGNQGLISKGAIPAGNIPGMDFDTLSAHWKDSDAKQLNIFDMLK